MSTKTWEEYHPEVAEVFRKGLINWPCEKIVTELRQVEQPCITLGAGDELFVAGASGEVFHSIDLGKMNPGRHKIVSRAIDVHGRVQPTAEDDEIAAKRTYWEAYAQWPRDVELQA